MRRSVIECKRPGNPLDGHPKLSNLTLSMIQVARDRCSAILDRNISSALKVPQLATIFPRTTSLQVPKNQSMVYREKSRILLQPSVEFCGYFPAGVCQLGAIFDEAGNYASPAKLSSSAMLLDVVCASVVNISDRFEKPI